MNSTASNLLRAAALGLVALVALAPATAQNRLDDLKPERRYDADVVRAIEMSEARRAEAFEKLSAARTEPDASGFDVLKYTIRLEPNFTNRTIAATTRVDAAASTAGLASVDLDFVGFTISSVTVDGSAAEYARVNSGRTLRVTLPRAFNASETFAVEVAYSGVPPIEGGLGFGFTNAGAATFAEPEGARLWFPSKDRPSDKAQYEGFITVPNNLVVASNGRLVDETPAGNRTTYHWLETHQITTYLISLAISDYRRIDDTYGDMPVWHYVYPEVESAARRDFARTPAMLAAFEARLGVPYPFDKYGHALFQNFGGAMEHQSCTSYGASLITGDNRYDRVVAHELGHQWFGNLVSPAEWEEIWLNEGFATWTEFLWTEHHDPAFLGDLLAGRESIYIGHESSVGAYPLYAPPRSRLFGTTIYQKGGWVVHMLRQLVGDEAFFAGIRAYLEENSFGNGRSTTLRAAMEAASGRDLSSFFDEWVYGTGYPVYDATWSSRAFAGGVHQVDVRVRQTQSTPTVFTYPLEVEVVGADGVRERRTIEVSSADSVASLCVGFAPVALALDPDNRVLGTASIAPGSVPAQPAMCGEPPPPPAVIITEVTWKGGALRVEGSNFVVHDAVVEVNGTELARTKYPKRFRTPDGKTTVVVGKQAGLRQLVPAGTPVQVTVLNHSTGERSAPVEFTR
jgi:aminopeptidase N